MPAPVFISSTSASATTFTMPTYAVGDMILVFAFNATTTPPSNPDGNPGTPNAWTTYYSATGTNSQSVLVAGRIAHQTGLTSATWTGATRILVSVWRNVVRPVPGTTFVPAVTSSAAGTAMTIPALTLLAGGNSQVVTAMWAAAGTALTTPSGFTRMNTQGSAPITAHDRANTTTAATSAPTQSVTITTSSTWIACQIELIGTRSWLSGRRW